MLKINEIFHSIQGEGSRAGDPCVFIRLTGCNLRCTYCDTAYAFEEGELISIEGIIERVREFGCNLVEVTGGEPLMQDESVELMNRLNEEGFNVMLETGGSLPVDKVNPAVKIILDMKCPSSGMAKKNLYANLEKLQSDDEVKFVIGNREDFEWSVELINRYQISGKLTILFSPVFNELAPSELAEWILKERIKVRMQIQMHKYIWDPNKRGV